MAITIKVDGNSKVSIDDSVLSDIVGLATTEVAGVVGMVSNSRIKDGVTNLLKKENYSKGVSVEVTDQSLTIDIHIAVKFGTNIIEVCRNVQKAVSFQVTQALGIEVSSTNVHVDDIK